MASILTSTLLVGLGFNGGVISSFPSFIWPSRAHYHNSPTSGPAGTSRETTTAKCCSDRENKSEEQRDDNEEEEEEQKDRKNKKRSKEGGAHIQDSATVKGAPTEDPEPSDQNQTEPYSTSISKQQDSKHSKRVALAVGEGQCTKWERESQTHCVHSGESQSPLSPIAVNMLFHIHPQPLTPELSFLLALFTFISAPDSVDMENLTGL